MTTPTVPQLLKILEARFERHVHRHRGLTWSTVSARLEGKTAALFAAATEVGAVVADQPPESQAALRDFGRALGVAFQLVDDLRSGKPVQATRGPRLGTFRETERVLAGFDDGKTDEGPSAGPASLLGREIARQRGWSAPDPAAAPELEGRQSDG